MTRGREGRRREGRIQKKEVGCEGGGCACVCVRVCFEGNWGAEESGAMSCVWAGLGAGVRARGTTKTRGGGVGGWVAKTHFNTLCRRRFPFLSLRPARACFTCVTRARIGAPAGKREQRGDAPGEKAQAHAQAHAHACTRSLPPSPGGPSRSPPLAPCVSIPAPARAPPRNRTLRLGRARTHTP